MMLSFTEIKLNGRNARDCVIKAMRILLCKYIIKEWLSSKTMTIRMLVLLLIIIFERFCLCIKLLHNVFGCSNDMGEIVKMFMDKFFFISSIISSFNKGQSPYNGKLSDFSFYIDSQKSAHRKFKK